MCSHESFFRVTGRASKWLFVIHISWLHWNQEAVVSSNGTQLRIVGIVCNMFPHLGYHVINEWSWYLRGWPCSSEHGSIHTPQLLVYRYNSDKYQFCRIAFGYLISAVEENSILRQADVDECLSTLLWSALIFTRILYTANRPVRFVPVNKSKGGKTYSPCNMHTFPFEWFPVAFMTTRAHEGGPDVICHALPPTWTRACNSMYTPQNTWPL